MTVKLFGGEVDKMIKDSLLKKGLKVKGDILYYASSAGRLSRLEVAVEMVEPEIEHVIIKEIGTKKKEKAMENSTSYGRVP